MRASSSSGSESSPASPSVRAAGREAARLGAEAFSKKQFRARACRRCNDCALADRPAHP